MTYTSEQQKANRDKWVAALRSGEYKQGKGALVVEDADGPFYCCLGVACQVASDNGVTGAFDAGNQVLSEAVMDWLGVRDECGGLVDDVAERGALTELNDDTDFDFNQLADLIDAGGVAVR